MKTTEIVDWVKTEFHPLTLATPDATLVQLASNALRYWNTHSAYKATRMYNYASPAVTCTIDTDIKTVVSVYPSVLTENLFSDHPMWVLLGFITLDKWTQDLMLLSHTYEGYKIYLGSDFRWTFERSGDPSVGGKIYIQNAPTDATKLMVVGTKRIVENEDIKDEFIIDWLLNYTKSLVKMAEGNTLRKAGTIGLPNDGEQLVTEGKEEATTLQDKLRKEGVWMLGAMRK